MDRKDHMDDAPPAEKIGDVGGDELQGLRHRLMRERARLASRVAREESDLKNHLHAVGERAPCAFLSPTAASEDAEQEVRSMMSSQARHDLQNVDRALERLREDPASFGKCGHCGRKISADRLDLLPQTTTCERCVGKRD
jgi:DnaK suppressor protein